MRAFSLLPLTLLSTLAAAASIADFPECATSCFINAVASSSCGIGDNYCQCTTGAASIRADAIACLCTSTCTATDLMKAQQVSNSICSAALAASSETYAATTVGLDVCQAQATGGARGGSGSDGSGTTTAASSDASATSGLSESASASASAAMESQTGNAAAPAVTGMVGFQGAVMGVIGLGLMAL